jgi:phosphatidylserine/phosphatidylglycerophosphate/cardiolipin synthase-like enzyme
VLHHKFGVIDQKTVIVGSQNWSESANYINDETLVVIEDSSIAKQFDQEYARLVSFAKFGRPSWLLREIERQQQICQNQGFNI